MTDKDMAEFAERVLADLERVPPWQGISFRGRPAGAVFGVGRRSVVSAGLVATSRDPRVATENFTTPGIFAVVGTQGRAIETISQRPHEREVVFLPSTVFVAAATAEIDDLEVLIVRQVDLGADPDSLEPLDLEAVGRFVASRVREARGRDPVAVDSPEKYAGDID